jgi:hypothetical protein
VAVTPPTQWTELCGAPTIVPYCPWQQPVRTCRSPCLGMAAHLRFQGSSLPALCFAQFQGPRAQFIDFRDRWPFVYVMPQDVAVYCHAGRSSLTLWGTFWAAWTMLGQDVLVTVILAAFTHESHELICDVSHHGRTSAGCAYCFPMSL